MSLGRWEVGESEKGEWFRNHGGEIRDKNKEARIFAEGWLRDYSYIYALIFIRKLVNCLCHMTEINLNVVLKAH